MAILVPEHKLLFLLVPGTGCSTLANSLIQQLGAEWFPSVSVVRDGKTLVQRKHHDLQALLTHGVLTEIERRELTVVANVRNPFDRMATYWQRFASDWTEKSLDFSARQIERNEGAHDEKQLEASRERLEQRRRRLRRRSRLARLSGFNAWATRTILRWRAEDARAEDPSRARQLRMYPMTDDVDHLLRQEQLEADLQALLRDRGCPIDVTIPRRNVTPGKRPFQDYWWSPVAGLLQRSYAEELSMHGYSLRPDDSVSHAVSRA